MSSLMFRLPPEEAAFPLRWWEVVLGAIAMAGATFGLIWGFALLEAVLAP